MKSDFEVFLRKIADKGKTGIRLPMKEKVPYVKVSTILMLVSTKIT
jgi:hypothetical protein